MWVSAIFLRKSYVVAFRSTAETKRIGSIAVDFSGGVKGNFPLAGQGRQPCPVDCCLRQSTGYYLTQKSAGWQQAATLPCYPEKNKNDREDEMKLTRHNGRAGKNGAYNPKHNDRRFDVENSGHIDPQRARKNIYWDCYQGFSGELLGTGKQSFSFEEVER